ncbi:cytochrome P450 [Nocardioides deserti]|uniref:Cytochrome P450 n=1 Tax=Nocardioides deserti TaxID=1588644 RepID=A0ABR6U8P0_9ACTN|nr:cytochrome P450 [Nocardioides deserti]MBC2960817.1 cytochrome P450 [Nocardioides deserti]GGO77459.1 putative cytochrome P450 [Nocardioides deserti]
MTTTADRAAAPPVLDPYDYAFHEDPYPTYARLRAESPLHHNVEHDFWALSRHADVAAAVRDDETFSNAMGVSLDKSAWGPHAHKVMSFLAMDAPHQARLRSLVSRAFTPRRVRELEPRVQALTEHYLGLALDGAGSGDEVELDWIAAFAGKLPMDVISEMMGVPEADRDEVRRLADLVVHREEGVHDVPPAGMEAALTLVGYYAEMLAERRRAPSEDLTSALLEARIDDGSADGDRLGDDEIIAFLFLMVVAGNETTTKLLGNALFHLTASPAQLDDVLAAGPGPDGLVAPWIEETLRHDTSSQMVARHLKRDLELHGTVAPAGSKLLLLLGSANRDERVFSEPTVFDLHRDKAELSQILSFGGGRHFCLGANLARLEARVVLDHLVRVAGGLEVDHDAAVRVHSTSVRGFASLPTRIRLR